MNEKSNISHSATILRVQDVKTSAEFYSSKLGFSKEFEYGEPVYYIVILRGGLTIHLTEHKNHTIEEGNPILYVFVHDVDSLYQEFKSQGVENLSEPETQEYGMRDFDLIDIDGYRITFGTGIE